MTRRAGEPGTGTLTRQGVVLGTPFYMSPEQAQALPNLDLRTDLWRWAILYECLAGNRARRRHYEQIIISICTTDPPEFAASTPASRPRLPSGAQGDAARSYASFPERQGKCSTSASNRNRSLRCPVRLRRPLGRGSKHRARASHETVQEGGAGTRVSWTNGDPKPGIAATIMSDDEARLSRARGMRRRGLIALGVTVMAAAFVLTFGLMRKETGDARGLISSTPASAIASADTPPSTSAGIPEPPAPHASADVATPIASHAAVTGVAKVTKRVAAPNTAVAVTTPVPPPPVASAAPPRPALRAAPDQDQLSLKMKLRSIGLFFASLPRSGSSHLRPGPGG